MAQAYFRIGGRALEMLGPRAEQIAHLLELDRRKVASRPCGTRCAALRA